MHTHDCAQKVLYCYHMSLYNLRCHKALRMHYNFLFMSLLMLGF